MLFGNLLLLLPLLPGVLVVHLGLVEAGHEVVEGSKELVALRRRWVLTEQATHSVELQSINKYINQQIDQSINNLFNQ